MRRRVGSRRVRAGWLLAAVLVPAAALLAASLITSRPCGDFVPMARGALSCAASAVVGPTGGQVLFVTVATFVGYALVKAFRSRR